MDMYGHLWSIFIYILFWVVLATSPLIYGAPGQDCGRRFNPASLEKHRAAGWLSRGCGGLEISPKIEEFIMIKHLWAILNLIHNIHNIIIIYWIILNQLMILMLTKRWSLQSYMYHWTKTNKTWWDLMGTFFIGAVCHLMAEHGTGLSERLWQDSLDLRVTEPAAAWGQVAGAALSPSVDSATRNGKTWDLGGCWDINGYQVMNMIWYDYDGS